MVYFNFPFFTWGKRKKESIYVQQMKFLAGFCGAASEHQVFYTRYGPQPVIPSEPASPKSNYFDCHLIGGEKRGARNAATQQVISWEVGLNARQPHSASGFPAAVSQCLRSCKRHWARLKKKVRPSSGSSSGCRL